MTQTVHSGEVRVHPSEVIEVYGKTESGREVSIYLTTPARETLRATFSFSDAHKEHLGHSYWHVVNGEKEPCSICTEVSTKALAERKQNIREEQRAPKNP
jgi:hypothetical protein